MTVKWYTNKKGQRIGWLSKGIFRKRVQGSKHQLQFPPAWGIDEKTFKEISTATEIRILDTETNTVHKASYMTWKEKGFVQNRGHGEQRFLTLKDHEEYEDNQVQFTQDIIWFNALAV